MPLIASVARHYRDSQAVDRTELMQEGVVGLLRAVRRYDPELGTPFWAYASWWVRQAMQKLVAEMTRPVVLSDRALRRLARIKDARRDHLSRHGREPSASDLAASTGMPPEQVDRLLAAECAPRGLEEPVGGEQGRSATVGERVVDPAAHEDFGEVVERSEVEQVRKLCTQLAGRERGIVSKHYGLGRPAQTLREIAEELGLSVERVRQIEVAALTKLREALEHGDPLRAGGPAFREAPAGDRPFELRRRLRRALAAEKVPAPEATDLLIAANEVAGCAWKDGGRPERLRLGRIGGTLVCEIFDRGSGFNGNGKLGLCIARMLSTRIEEVTSPAGHTVRLWL